MARNALIKLRRGIASVWSSVNPVLDDGEPGWDKTSATLKVGDGSTAWNSLPALGSGTTVPTVGSFTYDSSGNIASDPDGNTYTWNTDGTPATQSKGGVTRTFNWNTDGTLASVA